jgi:hypothetical protein
MANVPVLSGSSMPVCWTVALLLLVLLCHQPCLEVIGKEGERKARQGRWLWDAVYGTVPTT